MKFKLIKKYLQTKYFLKKGFDNLPNDKLKHNLLQALPFWISSVLTGLIAVFYAKVFFWAEEFTLFLFKYNKAWLFAITPLTLLLAWFIVQKYAPMSKGSGIPQVMAAIDKANPKEHFLIKKLLSLRIIIVKIISSCLVVLGGGITGREGPTIQIAGSIFSKVNSSLPSWWPKVSKKNSIIAGAASGLAAAFNTPLGGIVFAVEELAKNHLNHFRTALFTAVIIAGLTAQGLLGPYLYLGYPTLKGSTLNVFAGLMLVALLAGLIGASMSKFILKILKWKSTFSISKQLIYIIFIGLAIATAIYFLGSEAMGSGKDIMSRTLFTADKSMHWYTPFVRIVGLIGTFSVGAAGGIFAPSLSAGASIGALFAHLMHYTEANSNLLILSGMVAFLTGVTRSPFTSAILVLEMTDRHNVIFQLMLAALIANVFAQMIDRHSIYEHLKLQYIQQLEADKSESNNLSKKDKAN